MVYVSVDNVANIIIMYMTCIIHSKEIENEDVAAMDEAAARKKRRRKIFKKLFCCFSKF